MKVLNTIKRVVLTILGVIFFLFALLMTIILLNRNDYGVTEFGSNSLIIIDSELADFGVTDEENSDEELTDGKYNEGDLLIVKNLRLDRIKVGDEIFAYSVDDKNVAHVNVGIVGEIYLDEKAIAYENGSGFSSEFIIGKTSKIYPKYGTVLSIFQSKWGFLFLILIPCFLIFIYELYALIVEIKYGE